MAKPHENSSVLVVETVVCLVNRGMVSSSLNYCEPYRSVTFLQLESLSC